MNLNAVLDVVTGLVLMYLLLSLFCTAINEIVAWATNQRAKTLRSALQQLIDDPRLKALFYDHGLIDGAKVAANKGTQPVKQATALPAPATNVVDGVTQASPAAAPSNKLQPAADNAPPVDQHPSYLSSKTVAAAITGSLAAYLQPDADPLSTNVTFPQLQTAIERLQINSNIRDSLSACLSDAQGNIDKFRDNVAQWFDSAMDRLSGAYKRYIQIVTVVVSVIVVILLNADTLHVADRLWNDHALGGAVSQMAGQISALNQPLDQSIQTLYPQCAAGSKDQAATKQSDGNTQSGTNGESADNGIANPIGTICAVNAALRPLPIGWPDQDFSKYWSQAQIPGRVWVVILKILGLVITALALTQGAPFWFDLLQKIMNFRATGNKPKSQTQP